MERKVVVLSCAHPKKTKMNLFHTHIWEVVSTDFTPPLSEQERYLQNHDLLGHNWAYNGTTHIYSKCKECGKIKQQDVLGKFVS